MGGALLLGRLLRWCLRGRRNWLAVAGSSETCPILPPTVQLTQALRWTVAAV